MNEAFASQVVACLRQLGLADDAAHVNPNGGAIALGHPLGMSGARLVMTAVHQMEKSGGRCALATMCIGVGQGIAVAWNGFRSGSMRSDAYVATPPAGTQPDFHYPPYVSSVGAFASPALGSAAAHGFRANRPDFRSGYRLSFRLGFDRTT